MKFLTIKNKVFIISLLTIASISVLTGCGRKNHENDDNYYDETEDDEYYESADTIEEDPCTDATWDTLYDQREVLMDLFADAQDMQDAGKIEVTDEFNDDMNKAADLINYFCEYKQTDISESMALSVKNEMTDIIAKLEAYTQE